MSQKYRMNILCLCFLQEIEKKKRKEGKLKNEPKLTKKQQEMMHAQLQKESSIRVKCKQVIIEAMLLQCDSQTSVLRYFTMKQKR